MFGGYDELLRLFLPEQSVFTNQASAAAAGRTPTPPAAIVRTGDFLFMPPTCTAASLVGDFNGWNPSATPMTRAQNGVRSVVVPGTSAPRGRFTSSVFRRAMAGRFTVQTPAP